jgi:hypothetical protein
LNHNKKHNKNHQTINQQMAEDVAEAMAAADVAEGGACEIGSLEMPPAEWLFSAAATFQQSYGQIHPYLAAGLCIAGEANMDLINIHPPE